MSSPFYQLVTKNGRSTFYTFFDNMNSEQRLHIRVMIYHLDQDEYQSTRAMIKSVHGSQSMDDNEPLEFMKYVIIHWKGEIIAVDMDTLHYVHAPKNQSLTKHLLKRTPQQGESLPLLSSNGRLTMGPSLHKGDTSKSRAKLVYGTEKHGIVSVIFNIFRDPNVRNGINLSVAKNVNKDSMYGACIYATHPKYLILKNATTLPPVPSKEHIHKMKTSKYWVLDESEKKYMNKDNTDKILLPRGKVVKHKK